MPVLIAYIAANACMVTAAIRSDIGRGKLIRATASLVLFNAGLLILMWGKVHNQL